MIIFTFQYEIPYLKPKRQLSSSMNDSKTQQYFKKLILI